MNSLADEVEKKYSDPNDLTESEKLELEKVEFNKKYGKTKTEYQKIKEEAEALAKEQEIQKKKRELKEKRDREQARRELAKKIAAEKKFNEKINDKLDKEVKEHFQQEKDWEDFNGLDDRGQEELDELDEELAE